MIRKLLGMVFNRWTLTAVLTLALSLLLWMAGPLVAIAESRPLESEAARWQSIAAVAGLALLLVIWRSWRAHRGNAAVVNQLLAATPAVEKENESPDLQAVRQRFEQAIQTLRRARFGESGLLSGWSARFRGRYLYELPWYLIIGAPGSGKTTALQNCGLKFPLAGKVGDTAVRGMGGTRNCDWWFTDQAVLIDTAGRFTTQDSDRENDRITWGGFLAMLKRTRPRQPVNGLLVTISVTDLLTRSAVERSQHAAAVRQRLQELHEDLGIRFPVYVLVTKSDLLAGFMDYFTRLDKEQRATPWGATFAQGEGSAGAVATFDREFGALLQRLEDGLLDRLQAETDVQRRARIYGFAGQFAALQDLLKEFIEAVFSSSPYEKETLLRGFYFVSGTQEGTPIDRVLGTVARSYGLERAVMEPNQSSGKSYFLNRLLGEVVFAESGLAGTNRKWERQRRWLTVGAYAAIAVIGVGVLSLWTVSYLRNRSYVDEVARRADEIRGLLQTTGERTSLEVLPILPALAATRDLALEHDRSGVRLGLGLSQKPKLESAARASYRRMLVDGLLPRVGLRIEDQLRQAGEAPEKQYEALKAYLMLHDANHFDPGALRAYVEADWDAQLGRSVSVAKRAELTEHLKALLAEGAAVSPVAEDKALVSHHRARLAAMPLPQRIYHRMQYQGLGADFPEFTAVRAAGRSAALVFTRASGAPLTKGVPGLFSYDGYHRGFQKEVGRVAHQLAEEQSWVLGVGTAPKNAAALAQGDEPLLDDVRRIYLNEYAAAWEDFIADIRLLPPTSMAQSIQMASLLSAPDTPLPPLIKAMSRETTLLAAGGKSGLDKASDRLDQAIEESRKKIAGTSNATRSQPARRIESLVDDRFAALRGLVTAPEGGKAPIEATIALIGEVNVFLNAVDLALRRGDPPPLSQLPIGPRVAQLPEPVRSMLNVLSVDSTRLSHISVRETLGRLVRSQVGEFCQQAAAGRYPLDKASTRDATQDDFALLFGPGGKFEQTFPKLTNYVDTTRRPWRFRVIEGIPLGQDVGTLPEFQRAQAIRETFFPAGNTPSLRLQFKPIEMDPGIKQFILDVDGQIVRYDHGPQIPSAIQWPGPRGTTQVRVQVSPPGAGGTFGSVYEGPWALFRLFDRVQIEPTSAPERMRATFDVDGRKAVFEITTSSVHNPFRLRELNDFSCPMGL